MPYESSPALIAIAIEPRSRSRLKGFLRALERVTARDPSLTWEIDSESGQFLLRGVSETQLDGAIRELKRGGRRLDVGAPQVLYRERIGRAVEVDVTHKIPRQGDGEFARLRLRFEPNIPGSGVEVVNLAEAALPEFMVEHAQRGLLEALQRGLLAGFPLIDLRILLLDGAYHDLDSTPAAFMAAAHKAVRRLRDQAEPYLVEPVMALTITAPDADRERVLAQLRPRAVVRDEITGGPRVVVRALARLSMLFGFAGALQGVTRNRATYDLVFSHYGSIPQAPPDDPTFTPAMGMRLRA
jgi:elongation factor G